MNRLRTHIARIIVAVLVWMGFSLYLVQPTQANQSSQAFASWLSKMAKPSDGADLQQELNDLGKSGEHLDQIIEKASRIVSSNNENFDFSFAESTASQHLDQLLLIEWNQFQTGNAMASIPAQQSAKVAVQATLDKLGTVGLATVGAERFDVYTKTDGQSLVTEKALATSLVPMVDCIAIGAP